MAERGLDAPVDRSSGRGWKPPHLTGLPEKQREDHVRVGLGFREEDDTKIPSEDPRGGMLGLGVVAQSIHGKDAMSALVNDRPRACNWRSVFAAAAIALISSAQTAGQTDVCGNIDTDTVWDIGRSPYTLTCSVTVLAGVTLTIDPGVEVELIGYYNDLYVDGRLEAADATLNLVTSHVDGYSELIARSGGELDLTGGTVLGGGKTIVLDGGQADISGVTFEAQLIYNGGSTGTVSGSVVGSLTLSTSGALITENTIFAIYLNGGVPTVTNNTLTGSVPLSINDPDIDVSGIAGNMYEATDPWINIQGTLDNSGTLGFVDGVLRRYHLRGSLTVAPGATLTLAPGVTLESRSRYWDIYVDGRLEATDATIGLNDCYQSWYSELVVRSGGEVDLSGGTVLGCGKTIVQDGGQATLSGVTFSGQTIFDSGSSGTVQDCQFGSVSIHSEAAIVATCNDFSTGFMAALGTSGATIDVTENWWGTNDPAEIETRIYDCNDDASRPCVNYEPFRLWGPCPPALAIEILFDRHWRHIGLGVLEDPSPLYNDDYFPSEDPPLSSYIKDFPLPGVPQHSAVLRLRVAEMLTDGSNFLLNDVPLGNAPTGLIGMSPFTETADESMAVSIEIPVPTSLLTEGQNVLEIRATGDDDFLISDITIVAFDTAAAEFNLATYRLALAAEMAMQSWYMCGNLVDCISDLCEFFEWAENCSIVESMGDAAELPPVLVITAESPVDIELIDPIGRSLSPAGIAIDGGLYFEVEFLEDAESRDVIALRDYALISGEYLLRITLHDGEAQGEYSINLIDTSRARYEPLARGWVLNSGETAEIAFSLTALTAPGDSDDDGDVDADDFAAFEGCWTGPGGGVFHGCVAFDFDHDGDVDCGDWEQFVLAWTAPGYPPEFEQCAGPAIPAVSEWSMVVMTLLVLTAGTLVYARRRGIHA